MTCPHCKSQLNLIKTEFDRVLEIYLQCPSCGYKTGECEIVEWEQIEL